MERVEEDNVRNIVKGIDEREAKIEWIKYKMGQNKRGETGHSEEQEGRRGQRFVLQVCPLMSHLVVK